MYKSIISLCLILFSFILNSHSGFAQDLSDPAVIKKVYQMSSEIMDLGKMARGKLDDTQLRAFNQRMLGDHKVGIETIQKLSSTFDVGLNIKNGNQDKIEQLEALSGKAFEKEYVKTAVSSHRNLLSTVQDVLIPAAKSPLVKALLQNYIPRLSSLLDSAQGLSGLINKKAQ